MAFIASDWYWWIGGDPTTRKPTDPPPPEGAKLYSSKRNTYVPDTDPAYVQWVQTNRIAPHVAAESDIWINMQTVLAPWLWNGETFSQPTETTYTQAQLQQYSAGVRWKTETKDITSGGIPVKMDDRSKQMIGNAAAQARVNNNFSTSWVGADGKIYPIDATKMLKMADDVAAHIDACFDQYAQTDADIKSGAVSTLQQVEDAYSGIG